MKLLKSLSLYTIASFIERGIGFLTLPLFTFYLSTQDFGTLALLTSIFSFIFPLVTLGSTGAISVAYFRLDNSKYGEYFTSTILAPFLMMLLLTLLTFMFKAVITDLFKVPFYWLLIIPFFCFLSFLVSILLVDYQVNNQPRQYVTFSLSSSIISAGLSLLFVAAFKYGYGGKLIGQYSAVLCFAIIGLFLMKKRGILVKKLNLDDVKDSIGFGLPLIPHTIGAMVINMSDRLFITHYLNKEILGIYNIGYLAGSVLSLINAGFANAIVPFSYELFNQNTTVAKGKVVKVYWMYILILIVFILLIWLLTPFMFNHFIDKKFHGGTRFVVWIALGYFFQGIYLLFANIIFYLKKTKVLFYLSFFNIAINLTLNYLLVPRFGAMGAAYTLCISYFIFVVAVAFYCFRNFPLPWLTFNRKR